MKMNLKKGFTLIELLVVVAIIGILASVVLASLNTARTKGSDAAVKANLANMRVQAAIVYDNTTPNGYGTVANATCTATASTLFADPTIASAITQATAQSTAIACNSTTALFAVAATLKGGGYYCVDSTGTGVAKTTAQLVGGLSGAGATFALNTTTGICTP
ncbi:MAG: type II secretion system protein [bacterium]